MSLKSVPSLPRQGKAHPEVQRLPKGMISKGTWEQRTFAAKRFKKESK